MPRGSVSPRLSRPAGGRNRRSNHPAPLELKLESFEAALAAFEEEGGENLLADAMDKSGTILSSLGGAIPVVGSFAQELIDFILKELRPKWRRFWRR